ncbi:MAG: PspA/IM30 family protein [Myxococcota bacterium]
MGILDRLNRIVRSEINDLKSGSSGRGGDFSDVESSLREARRQRAELRREDRRIAKAIREARDRADQWEERAVMALKSGEEDLARDALIVRNEALEEAERLREDLEEHRMYLRDVESALEALELKLEGARGRSQGGSRPKSVRDAGSWDSEFRKRVDDRSGSSSASGRSRPSRPSRDDVRRERARRKNFETDEYFDEMDRMGDKIDAETAEAEAMDELSGDDWTDPGRRKLDERFERLERKKKRDDRDDDLADLKKKFE